MWSPFGHSASPSDPGPREDLSSFVSGHGELVQMVKNLPAMQESWVQSLGQEDPLEEEMKTYSSIHYGRIP